MKKKSKILIVATAVFCVITVIIMAINILGKRPKNNYEKHMEMAQKYIDELNYEQAIAELRMAIEIEPNDRAAYLALVDVYTEIGDYEGAIEVLITVTELMPDDSKVQAAVQICTGKLTDEAKRYESNRDYTSEGEMAAYILKLDEESIEGKLLTANAALCSGKLEKALEYYEEVLALDALNEEALVGKEKCEKELLLANAREADKIGKTQEALEYYKQILDNGWQDNVLNAEAYLKIAESFISVGELDNALEYALKGYESTGDTQCAEKIKVIKDAMIQQRKSETYQEGEIVNFGHRGIYGIVLCNNEVEEALSDKEDGFYSIDGYWYRVTSGNVYNSIPVRWIVLKDEGDTLLVMQEYIFVGHRWDVIMDGASLIWGNSEIRGYLNSEAFLQAYFTPEELGDIVTSTVSNTGAGNQGFVADTEDKLFLPSVEELKNYFSDDQERMARYYAFSKPAVTTPMVGWGDAGAYGDGYTCAYWTRDPYDINYGFGRPAMVDCNGSIGSYSRVYNTWSLGIRPMMRIKKSSLNYERAAQNVTITYSQDTVVAHDGEKVAYPVQLQGDYLSKNNKLYLWSEDGRGGSRFTDNMQYISRNALGVLTVRSKVYGITPTPIEGPIFTFKTKPCVEMVQTNSSTFLDCIEVYWEREEGGSFLYEIQRSTSKDGTYETIYRDGDETRQILREGTRLYFRDTDVQAGTEYWYRVRGLFGSWDSEAREYVYSESYEGMEAEYSVPIKGVLVYPAS